MIVIPSVWTWTEVGGVSEQDWSGRVSLGGGELSGIAPMYRLYPEEGPEIRKRRAWRKAVGALVPILGEARQNADGLWISSMTGSDTGAGLVS